MTEFHTQTKCLNLLDIQKDDNLKNKLTLTLKYVKITRERNSEKWCVLISRDDEIVEELFDISLIPSARAMKKIEISIKTKNGWSSFRTDKIAWNRSSFEAVHILGCPENFCSAQDIFRFLKEKVFVHMRLNSQLIGKKDQTKTREESEDEKEVTKKYKFDEQNEILKKELANIMGVHGRTNVYVFLLDRMRKTHPNADFSTPLLTNKTDKESLGRDISDLEKNFSVDTMYESVTGQYRKSKKEILVSEYPKPSNIHFVFPLVRKEDRVDKFEECEGKDLINNGFHVVCCLGIGCVAAKESDMEGITRTKNKTSCQYLTGEYKNYFISKVLLLPSLFINNRKIKGTHFGLDFIFYGYQKMNIPFFISLFNLVQTYKSKYSLIQRQFDLYKNQKKSILLDYKEEKSKKNEKVRKKKKKKVVEEEEDEEVMITGSTAKTEYRVDFSEAVKGIVFGGNTQELSRQFCIDFLSHVSGEDYDDRKFYEYLKDTKKRMEVVSRIEKIAIVFEQKCRESVRKKGLVQVELGIDNMSDFEEKFKLSGFENYKIEKKKQDVIVDEDEMDVKETFILTVEVNIFPPKDKKELLHVLKEVLEKKKNVCVVEGSVKEKMDKSCTYLLVFDCSAHFFSFDVQNVMDEHHKGKYKVDVDAIDNRKMRIVMEERMTEECQNSLKEKLGFGAGKEGE